MKKSHIMGVAAGTVLSTAFLLAGCEKQNEFYSDKASYVRDSDKGAVVLDKMVEGHDAFQETLTRELVVQFGGSAVPAAKGVCLMQVYRIEGDIAFDHYSPLAMEYLQSAPDGLKPVISRQYNDLQNKGVLQDEKLFWKTKLECGEDIVNDFPRELKNIIELRDRAHQKRFGL
jgi:hypothetical protein